MSLEKINIGKVYRNKKTGLLYKVEGMGRYTEEPMELELMVIYKALYQSTNPFWVRPYELFLVKFEEVV